MSNYYSSNPKLYVGIDCIIFGFNEGELNLLLLKRNFEPAMGEWSLMGGFVQEDESVVDAARRTRSLHCLLCAHQHQRIRQRIRTATQCFLGKYQ